MLGLGAKDMHGQGSSTTKFSFGVGGGKYFVSLHLGFRLQARYAPDLRPHVERRGYYWSVPGDHFLNQGDVTAGVILRF